MRSLTQVFVLVWIVWWIPSACGQQENIAKGKKYLLEPRPSYKLCTDPGDRTQLTDGIDHWIGTDVLVTVKAREKLASTDIWYHLGGWSDELPGPLRLSRCFDESEAGGHGRNPRDLSVQGP